ncbi:MAG: phage tail tape measure protein [Dehalococcoidia bacterium]|nr:phage tail tape measure protein [Dehalococcoidia bacterium]
MSSVIRSLVVRVGADLSEFDKSLKTMSKNLKSAGKEITAAGKSLTLGLTMPIVGAGAAAFKFAADVEDAVGAADQIFKGASGEVKTWARNLKSYYGIAEGEALSYANTMGAMLQNIGGLTEKEAAKQSQMLVKLAGDLTAMFGGTTASAVQALTGALKGNNAMLDNYGMGVNDATIKAKAFEMGLIEEGAALDLASKQAATLALIMEQTADAQGQAEREASGASGSLRALTTELKNLAISFGEILLPVITPFLAKINEAIQRFAGLDEGTQKTIVTILGLAAAIGPTLTVIGKLTTGIGGVIGGVSKAIGVIKGGGGLIAALGALAGPAGIVMIVIAALAALVLGIKYLWENNEGFRVAVTTAWNKIKEIAMAVFDWLKPYFIAIWESMTKAGAAAIEMFKSIFEAVFNSIKAFWDKWGPAIKVAFQIIWDYVKIYFETTFNAIKIVFQTIFEAIASIFDIFAAAFRGDWQGVWDGIKNYFATIWNGIVGIAENALNGIIRIVNKAIEWLNKIPAVNIKTIGEVDFSGAEIEKHAQGGIFTKPTLWGNHLIGESGPEALVPLDNISGGGYRTANIYLQLDGHTLAKVLGQQMTDIIRVRQGVKA